MSKTTYYAHNAYLTTDDGKIYRAVAIAGSWRLAIKASDTKYVFVNDTCYESAAEFLIPDIDIHNDFDIEEE